MLTDSGRDKILSWFLNIYIIVIIIISLIIFIKPREWLVFILNGILFIFILCFPLIVILLKNRNKEKTNNNLPTF